MRRRPDSRLLREENVLSQECPWDSRSSGRMGYVEADFVAKMLNASHFSRLCEGLPITIVVA